MLSFNITKEAYLKYVQWQLELQTNEPLCKFSYKV